MSYGSGKNGGWIRTCKQKRRNWILKRKDYIPHNIPVCSLGMGNDRSHFLSNKQAETRANRKRRSLNVHRKMFHMFGWVWGVWFWYTVFMRAYFLVCVWILSFSSIVIVWYSNCIDMINHCHAISNRNRHIALWHILQPQVRWICDQFSMYIGLRAMIQWISASGYFFPSFLHAKRGPKMCSIKVQLKRIQRKPRVLPITVTVSDHFIILVYPKHSLRLDFTAIAWFQQ